MSYCSARLLLRGCVSDPLPSNWHGADHIENTSCNTFSIVCTYFGRCLEMGLHVTIYSREVKFDQITRASKTPWIKMIVHRLITSGKIYTVLFIAGRNRRLVGWRQHWGRAVRPVLNPGHNTTPGRTCRWLTALAGPPSDGKHTGPNILISMLWLGERRWQPLSLSSRVIIARYGRLSIRMPVVNLIHFAV
jgi:hypothetical protein